MASIVNDNYKIRIKKGRRSQKNRKNSGKSSEDTTELIVIYLLVSFQRYQNSIKVIPQLYCKFVVVKVKVIFLRIQCFWVNEFTIFFDLLLFSAGRADRDILLRQSRLEQFYQDLYAVVTKTVVFDRKLANVFQGITHIELNWKWMKKKWASANSTSQGCLNIFRCWKCEKKFLSRWTAEIIQFIIQLSNTMQGLNDWS